MGRHTNSGLVSNVPTRALPSSRLVEAEGFGENTLDQTPTRDGKPSAPIERQPLLEVLVKGTRDGTEWRPATPIMSTGGRATRRREDDLRVDPQPSFATKRSNLATFEFESSTMSRRSTNYMTRDLRAVSACAGILSALRRRSFSSRPSRMRIWVIAFFSICRIRSRVTP